MRIATYWVLALPVMVFMGGWFTFWISVPAVLTLAAAGLPIWNTSDSPPKPALAYGSILAAFAVSVFWLCVSGAGGAGWQQGDWVKHYSVLRGLMSHSWPVVYEGDQPLVYYLAYYLVPALVGKVVGWHAALVALALETWLLYFLAALWVARLLGRNGVLGLLLFTCFSGLDVAGNLIIREQWAYDSWWARVQYSCAADLIMFVPQHLAIGWLGTAIVLESDRLGKPSLAACALLLSLCWSPFVTMGLTPLVLYTWWRHRGYRDRWAVQCAVAVTVFLPLLVFLQSRSSMLETYTWWMAGIQPSTFLTFLLLEWFLFAAALLLVEGGRLFTRPMVVLSLASLGVIPVLSFPGYSDFVMRASLPALFVLALQVVESALDGLRRRDLLVVPLLAVVAVGALHPLGMYRQAVARFSVELPRLEAVPQIPDLTNPTTKRPYGLQQYIGRTDTPFFEYLARR